jgi:DNA-binding transcriptional MerR regulator
VNTGTPLLIGDLADRTGASRRSLRYYESQGLLSARRGENGYRYYDDSAVVQVERIRELLAMGLPSRLVRAILPCVIDRHSPAMRCPEVRVTLRREIERLDEVAASVEESRRRVEALLAEAERPALAEGSA